MVRQSIKDRLPSIDMETEEDVQIDELSDS